ncbi:hypothetical protein H4S02_008125 [Coemansia sp. RSA 2611]|nr:hypothetical protein H4S02_008125 [Coemansia sp. RSA 2611]
MATAPTAQTGAANAGRRHKGSSLTSWLKKSSGSDASDTKKLASPAEEIKMVFLRQLKLSSFELDGKQYHSVFTGEQIVQQHQQQRIPGWPSLHMPCCPCARRQ